MNFIKLSIVILVMFLGQQVSLADTNANSKWVGTWVKTASWVTAPSKEVRSCGPSYKKNIEGLANYLSSITVLKTTIRTGDKSSSLNIIHSTKSNLISVHKLKRGLYISITLKDNSKHGTFMLLNVSIINDGGQFVCTDGRITKISKNNRA